MDPTRTDPGLLALCFMIVAPSVVLSLEREEFSGAPFFILFTTLSALAAIAAAASIAFGMPPYGVILIVVVQHLLLTIGHALEKL